MLKTARTRLLLFSIMIFSFFYRLAFVFQEAFPPGADIGLHNSIVHSITQQNNTTLLWNFYHMGGGSSDTFPGYHIFVSYLILFTGMPDYVAHALVVCLFSTVTVAVAFLITRKIWNTQTALIVTLLISVSRYDIEMLLWAGYPNVITLMLMPIIFYLILDRNRFSRLTFLTATSLMCSAIFVTHSLSAFMFITISCATVIFTTVFYKQTGQTLTSILELLSPLILGALITAPFLVQVAPAYLNTNAAAFTGGVKEIQQALLSERLIAADTVIVLFACSFLHFLFSKRYKGKVLTTSTILLFLWCLIPIGLTQAYIVELYTDYIRFLYFLLLPMLMLIGLGIYHCSHFVANISERLISRAKELPHYRQSKNKPMLRIMQHMSSKNLTVAFTVIFLLLTFLELPVFVSPSEGIRIQRYYQVMDNLGYEAIQWAQNNTAADSVFLGDASYGWWFGGFALRPTISGVDPQFLTNSREFEPALPTSRLLDTNYLVDNGLVQIREDGGYVGRHNPMFLAKLKNSYYPYPLCNFDNSKITVTLRNNGNVSIVNLSDLPVKDMHVEHDYNFASICTTWGNDLFNFTQTTTVYQGVRFVNMTEKIQSNNPTVSFDSINFVLDTKGDCIQLDNSSTVALIDSDMGVASQLIFVEEQPTITQLSEEQLVAMGLLYNLKGETNVELNFYVGIYTYPSNLNLRSSDKTAFYQFLVENTQTYKEKVADLPLDVFDYRQAIVSLNASYVIIRDSEQIPRFSNDPVFTCAFMNERVAIFQVVKLQ